MPDIDVDVQSNRRSEVKQYVIDRYGADHVADIITHERFQPKSVIQRLCQVFDVPYIEAKKVTDTIDIRQDDEETTLEELLPINETLREFKGKYSHIWEHAIRLDQTVANIGKHAAGVVITPEPIIEYMALERGKKGDLVTSWSDSAEFMVISDYGFQKIDLLGIQGLERHDYACKLIKERHGIDIDLNKLGPLRDPYDVEPDVLKLFTDGYTVGLFQFGSKGITSLIRSIQPDNAFDLCAANALYRPGAMKSGATWDYARIKRGDKDAEYPHDLAVPILSETYGLIAYQEQIMELSKKLAGFTPGQADDLRKAMGKLYRVKGGRAAKEYMQKHHKLWVTGTQSNQISKEISDEIWGFVLDRSSYNFNKSHAACYGLQAYQDAWLKEHYPLEMYASILTYPSGSSPTAKQDFIDKMVREAKSRNVKFLPPDINTSELGWIIDDEDGEEGLRFNLIGIKDVGDVAASKIIINRGDGYWSTDEVRERCGSKVNKRVMEALTEAGAFDSFGARHSWSGSEIARAEKERLRMVIKGTLESDQYADIIRPNIYTQEEVETLPNGEEVIVGGTITKVEKKMTKNGNPFANVTVAFEMNEWRVKLWSNSLMIFDELLVVGKAVMISGKKDEWQGFISVVCNDMQDIETMDDRAKEELLA
jgi:DNA polymerase-3 subunit alpha